MYPTLGIKRVLSDESYQAGLPPARLQAKQSESPGDFYTFEKKYQCEARVEQLLGSDVRQIVAVVLDSGRKVGTIAPAQASEFGWDPALSYSLVRALFDQMEVDLVVGTSNETVSAVKWPPIALLSMQSAAHIISRLYPLKQDASALSELDSAIANFDLGIAATLIEAARGEQSLESFWSTLKQKQPYDTDLFRAMLVLDQRSANAARRVTVLYPANAGEAVAQAYTDLDKALQRFDFPEARRLIGVAQNFGPADALWKKVVASKDRPDLLRALLVLEPERTFGFAKTYVKAQQGATPSGKKSVISALHKDLHKLDQALQECLQEIPYHSEKRPNVRESNMKGGFYCTQLTALYSRQRAEEGKANFTLLGDTKNRKKNNGIQENEERHNRICSHSEEVYLVLNQPSGNPDQKVYGAMIASQFGKLEVGKLRQLQDLSPEHVMMLGLMIKREKDGIWYTGTYYDPNDTDVHIRMKTRRLEAVLTWNKPALLTRTEDEALYYAGSRHALVMAVPDEAQLALPAPERPNGRDFASMSYTDAPFAADAVYYQLSSGIDAPLAGLKAYFQTLAAEEILALLLHVGCSTRGSGGAIKGNGAYLASQLGHAPALQQLCTAIGASSMDGEQMTTLLKFRGPAGNTMLHIASLKNHKEVVTVLLAFLNRALADEKINAEQAVSIVSAVKENGMSVLEVANLNQHVEIAQDLTQFLKTHAIN